MVLGRTFNEALTMTSKRLNLADFHFFEISLSIQQETGGNLAETLDGLASTLRKRKQMKLKVRALSSEARATAYILGSLPILMFGALDVLDHGYISILLDDPRGHFILGMAAGFLVGGIYVMIKLGQFEI
jgi:tight adherence protein B